MQVTSDNEWDGENIDVQDEVPRSNRHGHLPDVVVPRICITLLPGLAYAGTLVIYRGYEDGDVKGPADE